MELVSLKLYIFRLKKYHSRCLLQILKIKTSVHLQAKSLQKQDLLPSIDFLFFQNPL